MGKAWLALNTSKIRRIFELKESNMAMMISEVYDALIEAGASEEKARKAAEAVAQYENRLSKMEGDLGLLKWMVGTNILVTLGVLWKVLTL
jgi:hypothetical protein